LDKGIKGVVGQALEPGTGGGQLARLFGDDDTKVRRSSGFEMVDDSVGSECFLGSFAESYKLTAEGEFSGFGDHK